MPAAGGRLIQRSMFTYTHTHAHTERERATHLHTVHTNLMRKHGGHCRDNWCARMTGVRAFLIPSGRNRMPRGGVSPPLARRWKPNLSDEFNGTMLEGVTGGVLGATAKRLQSLKSYFRTDSSDLHATAPLEGSKWLFKQEDPELWSLSGGTNGALKLRTDAQPGIESAFPANLLLQRPTSACVQSFLNRSVPSRVWRLAP